MIQRAFQPTLAYARLRGGGLRPIGYKMEGRPALRPDSIGTAEGGKAERWSGTNR